MFWEVNVLYRFEKVGKEASPAYERQVLGESLMRRLCWILLLLLFTLGIAEA
jgi:hypothetical protein